MPDQQRDTHRLPHRIRTRRLQPGIDLGMGSLELVPHLLLGPPGDLPPQPTPVRPVPKRDRPDVPTPPGIEEDRVPTVTRDA
jgi:hypothetical protein